jgi:hypothetical protein
MKNTKQSAVSRRQAQVSPSSQLFSLTTEIQQLKNFAVDLQNKTEENTKILNSLNEQVFYATDSLNNQTNEENTGSLAARIKNLEDDVDSGGGGGIDPTDPSQPILIYDNFVVSGNGDPTGSIGRWQAFPTPGDTLAGSYVLNPVNIEIYEKASEPGHTGIVECRVDVEDGYMSTVNDSSLNSLSWNDINRLYYIFKPLVSSSDYTLQFGLFDDMDTPTKGVYLTGVNNNNWSFVTKDTGTTTVNGPTVVNDWCTLKIERLSSTSVLFQLNDDPEVIINTNIPTDFLIPGIRAEVDDFTPFDFLVDFFSLKLFGTAGEFPDVSAEAIIKKTRNTSGSTITKGKVVKIVGSQGSSGLLLIEKATNANVSADDVVGVTIEDIGNNKNGYIIKEGYLGGLATNTLGSDGDRLYLGTSGNLTTTRASAPAHPVKIGWIVNSGAGTSGSIYVSIEHGEHLENLHDVSLTSLQSNDFFAWDSVNNTWVNLDMPSVVALLLNNGIQKTITSGTATPTGGSDGDIYIQYT